MFGKDRNVIAFSVGLSFILISGSAVAATTTDDFTLFKRAIAPSYHLGYNGLITIPKAAPIGKYNVFIGSTVKEAGTIQGESLYNTRNSLVLGSSDDVELGYTKNVLLWENMDRTDLEADVYHFKARVLNMADYYLPQVSIGTTAVSLQANSFETTNDILFAPYIVSTVTVPFFGDGNELSITADMEWLHHAGQETQRFYNAGIDMKLLDESLIVVYELQGIGKSGQDARSAIRNASIGFQFWGLSLGVGMFDMNNPNPDAKEIVLTVGAALPFGDWFGGEK